MGLKNAASQNRTETGKELQIKISKTHKASCTPFICKQTARRGKPFTQQIVPDRKTFVQLKKQVPQIKTEPKETLEIVKEDCHVQIDDSSYRDWLLTQGIQLQMSPPSATPIVISPNPINIPAPTSTEMATMTPMDTQNQTMLPAQSKETEKTEDLDYLEKKPEEEEKQEDKTLDQAGGSQDDVNVQSFTEPNYLSWMQTLIDEDATEEESLERIQKLKNILELIENKHKPYTPQPKAKKLMTLCQLLKMKVKWRKIKKLKQKKN